MIIYPAIDLRAGQCVRLYQGDYARETIYAADPFSAVKTLVAEGAEWLHLVDLDGAKDPQHNQARLIAEIIQVSGVKVQTGGGIRTREQVKKLLAQGVARVVIGSLAAKNPKEVAEWLSIFGAEQIVLAFDVMYDNALQPMVMVDAWQTVSQVSLFGLLDHYQAAGLQHILCTSVMQDGTLNGPDYALYATLQTRFPLLKIQASGGVSSIEDIQLLREKNLAGTIIGRALYEKKFTLQQVLAC